MNVSNLNSENLSSVISNNILPRVILPFPPNITAYEIANKRLRSNIRSKAPNAFFIYRKVFMDHLLSLDHKFKMTDVSKLASEHWKHETQEVITTYKKISKQVEKELNNIRNKNLVYANDIEKHKFMKRKESKSIGECTISTFSINEKSSTNEIDNSKNKINNGGINCSKPNSIKILKYLQPRLSPNFNFNSILDENIMRLHDNELTISSIDCQISKDSNINNCYDYNYDYDYDYGHKKFCDPSTLINNSQDYFGDHNLEWYLNDFDH
ncbi:unnamed protein product [Rhizophagus irregularis]|uniref:MATA-HMG n=1 Tax=Rhizophagus irregularis TaxID=588596 RepID=A0A1B1EVB4_9GLOM|nr:MATA-HMG [Rhizophagus irregularis]PKY44020.1 hypothetical protein RhiirA4_458184 [Rhizophagus irregularis]CAB4424433.1 unnamed protein product [Rhizophagus irregularis]